MIESLARRRRENFEIYNVYITIFELFFGTFGVDPCHLLMALRLLSIMIVSKGEMVQYKKPLKSHYSTVPRNGLSLEWRIPVGRWKSLALGTLCAPALHSCARARAPS